MIWGWRPIAGEGEDNITIIVSKANPLISLFFNESSSVSLSELEARTTLRAVSLSNPNMQDKLPLWVMSVQQR